MSLLRHTGKCGLRSYLPKDHPLKPLEIGSEPTIEAYVARMVAVFREVRRVLRKDGTLWLNLGDSYASNGGHADKACNDRRGQYNIGNRPEHEQRDFRVRGNGDGALKPKDLCMIPARVALALQSDGWWLRSQIPWIKRNSMPESVLDRPSRAVEYVYLFSKDERYFFDNEAIRIPYNPNSVARYEKPMMGTAPTGRQEGGDFDRRIREKGQRDPNPNGRQRRNSDWWFESWQGLYHEDGELLGCLVNPAGYADAHFATYPAGLIKPFILAGTSARGCCPKCGAPWERIVETHSKDVPRHENGHGVHCPQTHHAGQTPHRTGGFESETKTLSWQPTCECGEWYCATCDIVLDSQHVIHNIKVPPNQLQKVREDVSTRQTEQIVLQPQMLRIIGQDSAGCEMRVVRQTVSPKESSGQVLQSVLLEQVDGAEEANNKRVCDEQKGIQTPLPSITPNGIKDGLCDGAPDDNVEDNGTEPTAERGCSSQERDQVGQSPGKPFVRNRQPTQPKAKGNVARAVPALREAVSNTGKCPHCNKGLTFRPFNPEPATILDIFFGSGTTGQVSLELGRRCIGIELNPEYIKLIQSRTHVTPGLQLA